MSSVVHALLAQVHQQLVQVDREEPLAGHRVQVAVQAVDHHDARVALFDRGADRVHELAGRKLGRVDLLHADQAGLRVLAQRNAQPVQPAEQRIGAFVEDEQRRVLAALGGARAEQG